MPDLRISRYYQSDPRSEASKGDRDYLLDKLRGAKFLIESINKRRKTIRNVIESLLKFQRDFFDHGVDQLRPLVLQDVADDVDVHMSTVSRVTTNKYVHTPHGIFELKFFFSAAVKQHSGGDMSAEAIKSRIRSLVGEKNTKKPLSDQAIANALKGDGIKVARRTVAKYREAMGILPSSKRKADVLPPAGSRWPANHRGGSSMHLEITFKNLRPREELQGPCRGPLRQARALSRPGGPGPPHGSVRAQRNAVLELVVNHARRDPHRRRRRRVVRTAIDKVFHTDGDHLASGKGAAFGPAQARDGGRRRWFPAGRGA